MEKEKIIEIKLNMKVILLKIKNVAKEKYYSNRVILMKENLMIINLMAMDIIYGQKIKMNIKEII